MTAPSPAIRWAFWFLAATSLLGCVACDAPPPSAAGAAQTLLGRRRQAQTLRQIADDAAARNDLKAALCAYGLLLDLWPDLPEARPGGPWITEQQRLSARLQRQTTLQTAMLRGQKLEAQLREHTFDISQMQHKILNIVDSVEPVEAPNPVPPPAPSAP